MPEKPSSISHSGGNHHLNDQIKLKERLTDEAIYFFFRSEGTKTSQTTCVSLKVCTPAFALSFPEYKSIDRTDYRYIFVSKLLGSLSSDHNRFQYVNFYAIFHSL